jgi:hypothetical protein
MALLPAKPVAGEEAWDLSKLTDKELGQLDRLSRKACGLLPPSVDPPRKGPPRRSPREAWAEYYARQIDQIEGEKEAAFRGKRPYELGDANRLLIHNACELWLGLIATPEQIWPHIAEGATYVERKRWLDREEEAARAAAAAAGWYKPCAGNKNARGSG